MVEHATNISLSIKRRATFGQQLGATTANRDAFERPNS